MTTATAVRVDVAHLSLQAPKDTDRQKRADAKRFFALARERRLWWATGTEAGDPDGGVRRALEAEAPAHGFELVTARANDAWIAFDQERLDGRITKHYEPVLTPSEGVGHHGPRGPLSATVDLDKIGRTSVIACHLMTRGRVPSDPNIDENRELLRAIAAEAKRLDDLDALVFYGGDQNIVDKHRDTFLGIADFTSAWDELKKWEGTGHGNIDVVASYDPDEAVAAAYCRALDDSEFPLHTDHFLVLAGFDVLVPERRPRRHACPTCGRKHRPPLADA